MKLLGALIAGGQSRRFGSDKALALIAGRPLLAHVIEGLEQQVDEVVVCGRQWPGLTSLPDRPATDQGPLGGICAALHHARDNGFDAVLTAGCDTLPVPGALAELLDDRPGVVKAAVRFVACGDGRSARRLSDRAAPTRHARLDPA